MCIYYCRSVFIRFRDIWMETHTLVIVFDVYLFVCWLTLNTPRHIYPFYESHFTRVCTAGADATLLYSHGQEAVDTNSVELSPGEPRDFPQSEKSHQHRPGCLLSLTHSRTASMMHCSGDYVRDERNMECLLLTTQPSTKYSNVPRVCLKPRGKRPSTVKIKFYD